MPRKSGPIGPVVLKVLVALAAALMLFAAQAMIQVSIERPTPTPCADYVYTDENGVTSCIPFVVTPP